MRRAALLASSLFGLFAVGKFSSAASLYCSGSNRFGQLGLHGTEAKSVPTLVTTKIRDVSAAGDHTLVLTERGEVLGCGSAKNSAIGRNTTSFSSTLSPIAELPACNYVAISTSESHSAALDDRGRVFLVGSVQGKPIAEPGVPLVMPPDAGKVVAIACGRSLTLLVDEHGQLWAKQLPTIDLFKLGLSGIVLVSMILTSSTDNSVTSDIVRIQTDEPIQNVSAGASFFLCLSKHGRLLSDGSNKYGELGRESNAVHSANQFSLKPVQWAPGESHERISAFSCGAKHALAVLEDGRVFAWGIGADGQLGLGIREVVNQVPRNSSPLPPVTHVAAGGAHSAAITSAGDVYVCGRNRDAQLGRGNELESQTATRDRFVPVTALKGKRVTRAALGANHSCFLVDE